MRNIVLSAAFVAAASLPIAGLASVVDASLIPDGTYLVKVEKVNDPTHITVALMHSGLESTLTASGAVRFDKIKAEDTLKVSIIKGKIPVLAIQ